MKKLTENKYFSADSDGDGVNDRQELADGTNPTNGDTDMVKVMGLRN